MPKTANNIQQSFIRNIKTEIAHMLVPIDQKFYENI